MSPVSIGLDALDRVSAITPDLPAGSALAVLALAVGLLVTLRAVGVPAWLAVAVALGVVSTRSVWSTVATGRDAVPVLLVAFAVVTVARSAGPGLRRTTAVLTALVAPWATWLAVPALLDKRDRGTARVAPAAAIVALALVVQVLLLFRARTLVPCAGVSAWASSLFDVWRPGASADASAWLALRQWASIVVGDVHAFGLVVAALGVATRGGSAAPLWMATKFAALVAVLTVAIGAVPPALGAALLLPWWAPWFGAGLWALVRRTAGRWPHGVAVAFAVTTASAVPALRSAVVVPSPWVTGTPAMARAAMADVPGVVAVVDATSSRRLRMAGATTIPADPAALPACTRSGMPVSAVGEVIALVEHAGMTTEDSPLYAPMSAVLRDLRSDQLVALGVAPSSLAWIGPQGLALLPRLDVDRAEQATLALALAARTDRAGRVAASRGRAEVTLSVDDMVGTHPLAVPLAVAARDGEATVDSAPWRLATGRHAALVVFDRAHDIVLRATAAAAPGLPVPLATHTQWQRTVVAGAADCVQATKAWTRLPGRPARIALPIAAASARRPVLAYVSADEQLHPTVQDVSSEPRHDDWGVDLFDTQDPAAADRLRAFAERDGLDRASIADRRWVARIAIAPREAWRPSRVALAAGTPEAVWAVRLAGHGFRAETQAVCTMEAGGERLFYGGYGPVDDDSPAQLTIRTLAGWHVVERSLVQVHQWTSRPRATVAFEMRSPRPLVLGMDATAAALGDTPQPLTVRVNDQVLAGDWQGARRVDVPASILRAGANTLSLEVPRTVQPPQDSRELGVLVRQLRLIDPGTRGRALP